MSELPNLEPRIPDSLLDDNEEDRLIATLAERDREIERLRHQMNTKYWDSVAEGNKSLRERIAELEESVVLTEEIVLEQLKRIAELEALLRRALPRLQDAGSLWGDIEREVMHGNEEGK